jgi:hypothetical protein
MVKNRGSMIEFVEKWRNKKKKEAEKKLAEIKPRKGKKKPFIGGVRNKL